MEFENLGIMGEWLWFKSVVMKFGVIEDEEFDCIGEFFFLFIVEEEEEELYVSLEDVELVWDVIKFDDINFLDLEDFFVLEGMFRKFFKFNLGCRIVNL